MGMEREKQCGLVEARGEEAEWLVLVGGQW